MLKIKSTLKETYLALLDLLYPEKNVCFICDEHDSSANISHICYNCLQEMTFLKGPRCSICGKPLEKGYLQEKCHDCMQEEHYFAKAISPLEYTGRVKEAIYKYKYGKKSYMYRALGPLLVQALRDQSFDDVDIITPVPLHKKKMAQRGFNQSELLAHYVSKSLNIPLNKKDLVRIRNTDIQNKLGKSERYKNIKGAFKVKNSQAFYGLTVLLIDDILTTGATVDECSRVLIKSGAQKVYVLTLATGRGWG